MSIRSRRARVIVTVLLGLALAATSTAYANDTPAGPGAGPATEQLPPTDAEWEDPDDLSGTADCEYPDTGDIEPGPCPGDADLGQPVATLASDSPSGSSSGSSSGSNPGTVAAPPVPAGATRTTIRITVTRNRVAPTAGSLDTTTQFRDTVVVDPPHVGAGTYAGGVGPSSVRIRRDGFPQLGQSTYRDGSARTLVFTTNNVSNCGLPALTRVGTLTPGRARIYYGDLSRGVIGVITYFGGSFTVEIVCDVRAR
jgi:hypothetical protein